MSSFLTDLGIAIKAKLDLKASSSDLATKVDKVAGKQLSTEDYTTAEKNKLAGLSNYSLPIASSTVLGGVKAGTNISIDGNGVISANDTSVAWTEVTGKPTFATVATSGSYADLSNKPTIPSAQVQSDWNAVTGIGVILNKPTIPTVPTTVSAFTNDSGYQTAAQVSTAIHAVVGAAPAALDTLAEIATQLQNDESAAAALVSTVSAKANSSDVYSKTDIDNMYGNIASLLDTINGEVI